MIAAAVEEQNATTNEMGAHASSAADRTAAIGRQVVSAVESSTRTDDAAEATAEASAELSRRAEDLQAVVHRFTL